MESAPRLGLIRYLMTNNKWLALRLKSQWVFPPPFYRASRCLSTAIGLIASCAAMAATSGNAGVRPLEGQTGAAYTTSASNDWEGPANGAVTDALPLSITAVAKGPDQINLSWPSVSNP